MTTINDRMLALFDGVCKNYCKYRQKDYCMKTMGDATLDKCPIPEWWDINDHLNNVQLLMVEIQERLSQEGNSGHPS